LQARIDGRTIAYPELNDGLGIYSFVASTTFGVQELEKRLQRGDVGGDGGGKEIFFWRRSRVKSRSLTAKAVRNDKILCSDVRNDNIS
jgi:hypothetical protein